MRYWISLIALVLVVGLADAGRRSGCSGGSCSVGNSGVQFVTYAAPMQTVTVMTQPVQNLGLVVGGLTPTINTTHHVYPTYFTTPTFYSSSATSGCSGGSCGRRR